MTDLFTYLDYRKFLKDAFEEHKRTRPSFSHRAFARMAGFASSNYVLLVMQGKRNLSSDAILKIAKALKLKKAEAEFFENLVRFNQARSDAERNVYYGRIAANRRYAEAKPLEKGQFEYYSKWYVPAIQEMVLLEDFREDPAWIAAQLMPPIQPREAEAAVKLLLEIGLLARDASGKLIQRQPHIRSGSAVTSLGLTNFQREMIERAASSIEATPADRREIGSVTFAVSAETLAQAKQLIRDFRSKLSGFLAENASNADAVYQFNIQLFNLTQVERKKGA